VTADPALRARAAAAAAARAERLARADPWPAAVREVREVFRRPLTPPELIGDPARRDRVLELLALQEVAHRAGQDERIREGALELANARLRVERDTLREELDAIRRELVTAAVQPAAPAPEGSQMASAGHMPASQGRDRPPAGADYARKVFPPSLASGSDFPAAPPIGRRPLYEPAAPRGRPTIKASAAALAIMSRPPPDPIGVAEERRAMEAAAAEEELS
jgi:hypothetical protein